MPHPSRSRITAPLLTGNPNKSQPRSLLIAYILSLSRTPFNKLPRASPPYVNHPPPLVFLTHPNQNNAANPCLRDSLSPSHQSLASFLRHAKVFFASFPLETPLPLRNSPQPAHSTIPSFSAAPLPPTPTAAPNAPPPLNPSKHTPFSLLLPICASPTRQRPVLILSAARCSPSPLWHRCALPPYRTVPLLPPQPPCRCSWPRYRTLRPPRDPSSKPQLPHKPSLPFLQQRNPARRLLPATRPLPYVWPLREQCVADTLAQGGGVLPRRSRRQPRVKFNSSWIFW